MPSCAGVPQKKRQCEAKLDSLWAPGSSLAIVSIEEYARKLESKYGSESMDKGDSDAEEGDRQLAIEDFKVDGEGSGPASSSLAAQAEMAAEPSGL